MSFDDERHRPSEDAWSEGWFHARHWRAAPLVGACRDIWETSSAPAPLGPGDRP
jgi:hypothetical protein